jgi:hypothetical protein
MLDLARRRFSVLATGIQIVTYSTFLVIAKDKLLACLILWRDMIRCEIINTILPPPGQSI